MIRDSEVHIASIRARHDAAAAHDEDDIADQSKAGFLADEADMALGMAGRRPGLELVAADRDAVAFAEDDIDRRAGPCGFGCEDLGAGGLLQRGDALDMVGMLMRHQHLTDRPALGLGRGEHLVGIGNVDGGAGAGSGVAQKRTGIVAERAEDMDVERHGKLRHSAVETPA
jgi:hypothetical protein